MLTKTVNDKHVFCFCFVSSGLIDGYSYDNKLHYILLFDITLHFSGQSDFLLSYLSLLVCL